MHIFIIESGCVRWTGWTLDGANKVERADVRVGWSKTIAARKIVQYFALAKSAI